MAENKGTAGKTHSREIRQKKADDEKVVQREATEKYRQFVERVDRARDDDAATVSLRAGSLAHQ